MSESDDYCFDVFISYKSFDSTVTWFEKYLEPMLKHALSLPLDREPQIFFDKKIRAGRDFPLELARALARSRILICLWSAGYLNSEWCAKELALMFEREGQSDSRSHKKPTGLIAVFSIHSHGKNVPPLLDRVQARDLSPYFKPIMAENGRTREELYDAVNEAAESLAEMIRHAPTFQMTWEESAAEEFYKLLFNPESPSQKKSPGFTK